MKSTSGRSSNLSAASLQDLRSANCKECMRTGLVHMFMWTNFETNNCFCSLSLVALSDIKSKHIIGITTQCLSKKSGRLDTHLKFICRRLLHCFTAAL